MQKKCGKSAENREKRPKKKKCDESRVPPLLVAYPAPAHISVIKLDDNGGGLDRRNARLSSRNSVSRTDHRVKVGA